MNITTPSNIFESPRLAIWNTYSNYLSGSTNGAFIVVSTNELNEQAHQALTNSARALGYGTKGTTFFTLSPVNSIKHPETPYDSINQPDTERFEKSVNHLSGKEIFRIIESLDPLCIVITDHKTIETIARAFSARLEIEVPTTLLGHNCCCFEDFERMLTQEKTKQRAWALFKTLPKLTSTNKPIR